MRRPAHTPQAGKLDQAAEMVRQLAEAHLRPPEDLLLRLISALFGAEQPQHVLALLGHVRAAAAASPAVLVAVLDGLASSKSSASTAIQAMALLAELRAGGDAVDGGVLGKLQRACLRANMVDDAAQVVGLMKSCFLCILRPRLIVVVIRSSATRTRRSRVSTRDGWRRISSARAYATSSCLRHRSDTPESFARRVVTLTD